MKKKPQIGYGAASVSDVHKVWTLNNQRIEYDEAKKLWDDPGSVDWSIAAYQTMAGIVMAQQRKAPAS